MFIRWYAAITWVATFCAGILWFYAFKGSGLSFEERILDIALAIGLVTIMYIFTKSSVIEWEWENKTHRKVLNELENIRKLLEKGE